MENYLSEVYCKMFGEEQKSVLTEQKIAVLVAEGLGIVEIDERLEILCIFQMVNRIDFSDSDDAKFVLENAVAHLRKIFPWFPVETDHEKMRFLEFEVIKTGSETLEEIRERFKEVRKKIRK